MGYREPINVSLFLLVPGEGRQPQFALCIPNSLGRTQRLEKLEQEGEMEGSASILGDGGFYGWEPKALVCYYRTEAGNVDIKFCRDGGTIRLPWNPLAKWS